MLGAVAVVVAAAVMDVVAIVGVAERADSVAVEAVCAAAVAAVVVAAVAVAAVAYAAAGSGVKWTLLFPRNSHVPGGTGRSTRRRRCGSPSR